MSKNSNRKSTTCFGKATSQPLTEYDTLEAAQSSAKYVHEKYGNSTKPMMVPYQCQQCSYWHLAPPTSSSSSGGRGAANTRPSYNTPKKSTNCYGKVSGEILTAYDTQSEANDAAQYVFEKYGNTMISYKCHGL